MVERLLGSFSYPWAKWFKGTKKLLKRGRDFDCLPHVMAQQIRNTAAKRNLKVSIKIEENQLRISIIHPIPIKLKKKRKNHAKVG